MRTLLVALLLVGCGGGDEPVVEAPAPTITARWARASGDGANQLPWSVAVDARGDVIVVGEYGGSFDLGGPLDTPKGVTISGFVAKLGRDGGRKWARRIGGTADASTFAVAVDGAGHAHVGGWFRGQMTLDGKTLESAGETDAYWIELDENGAVVRAMRFGDAGSQAVTSIATDADGVVLAGDFDGMVDLGTGPLASHGALDVFVARFGTAGKPVYARALGGPSLDRRPKVALGRDGTAFVAATYRGVPDLGGGPLPDRFDGTFLTRLSKSGAHLWSKGFSGEGWCYPTGLAVEDDRLAFAARFTDSVDLGGGTIKSESGEDALLGVFGDDGVLQKAQRYGGFGQDAISGLAWDHGALWMTGEVQTTFGPLTSAGSADLFVARLNPDLSIRVAARFGDAQLQRGQRLAVDPLGGAVVVGAFFGALDFGAARVSSNGGFDDGGGDVFVASFAP